MFSLRVKRLSREKSANHQVQVRNDWGVPLMHAVFHGCSSKGGTKVRLLINGEQPSFHKSLTLRDNFYPTRFVVWNERLAKH
jgi:hypothetical protein